MSKTRFPAGNSILYPGPTFAMDLHPDDLLRRLAYGEKRPMLMPHQRLGGHFFARLLDEMANSHTQLIKSLGSAPAAYRCARILREELPPQAFGVHVDHDQRAGTWNVLVFHQIPREMRVPRRRDPDGHIWIGPKEVARVLRISPSQASRIMDTSGVPVRRTGAGSVRSIRQQDLVILANRPRRWRNRTRKAA